MAFTESAKKVASLGLIKTVEVKVNGSYSSEEGKSIERILDGSALVSIDSSERVGEYLNFSGSVKLNSIYLDSEKQMVSENVETSFQDKVQVGEANATALVPKIKSIKQRRETSNFAEANVVVVVEVFGVSEENISYVEPTSTSSDFAIETKEVEAENLLCFASSEFMQSEDVEVSEQVTRVISVNSNLVVNKVIPNTNYIVVDGEIVREITYLAGEAVKKLQKRSDFSEEIALLNSEAESNLVTKFSLAKESVDLIQAEDQTKSTISIGSTISALMWGFEKVKFNVVEDVFSTEKELESNVSSFTSFSHSPTIILSETLNETVDVSDKKRIDEVVSVGSTVNTIESTGISNGKLNIKGKLSQKIIGKNYDNDEVVSIEIEIPYSVDTKIGAESETLLSEPSISVRCISAKNKAGKEASLSYEFNIMLDVISKRQELYISQLEEGGEKSKSEHSIVIYMPSQSETIFEIAKKLNVTPEVILAQNPGVSDESTPKKIVVWKNN